MEATKSANKGKNNQKGEFNYYQDLDRRIDILMEELRAVRNTRPTPPAPTDETNSLHNQDHEMNT